METLNRMLGMCRLDLLRNCPDNTANSKDDSLFRIAFLCCTPKLFVDNTLNGFSWSISFDVIKLQLPLVLLWTKWQLSHYSDVIIARWRLKSPASSLFTQPHSQVEIKENIKAPCHWPVCLTSEFPAPPWTNWQPTGSTSLRQAATQRCWRTPSSVPNHTWCQVKKRQQLSSRSIDTEFRVAICRVKFDKVHDVEQASSHEMSYNQNNMILSCLTSHTRNEPTKLKINPMSTLPGAAQNITWPIHCGMGSWVRPFLSSNTAAGENNKGTETYAYMNHPVTTS